VHGVANLVDCRRLGRWALARRERKPQAPPVGPGMWVGVGGAGGRVGGMAPGVVHRRRRPSVLIVRPRPPSFVQAGRL
jgi:hypothetical protein